MIKFLPVLFIFILGASLIYEAVLDTPTYDEPANMAAAFSYVYKNDYRLYPDNPSFVKFLAGLMLLPIKNNIHFPSNLESYTNYKKFDLYAFGRDFLYKSNNNADELIFLTRIPNILFTIFLGILLYIFAKDLYGENAGLLTLFFYTLDPNIRGHGHIFSFDIPFAFFVILAFYLTFKLLKNSNKKLFYAFLIALTFSLGVMTKFTALFFILSFALVIFLKKRKYVFFVPFVVLMPFIVLWLFAFLTNYNAKTFDYDRLPIIQSAHQEFKDNQTWKLINALPVPYFYKAGIQTMYVHNIISQPAYLLGEIHAKNDWFFYFPVSFLLKTPIPTLIFIMLTVAILVKKYLVKKKLLIRNYFPFVIGFSFFIFMMVFSHINNVFRYLFPSYILFFLGTGQIINFFNLKKPIVVFSGTMLLGYMVITSFFSFPYDLSYTNEFTGIPQKGYKYLSDSEVDWGQDLGRLAQFLKENKLNKEPILLSYLGTAEPAYYDIKYKPLRFDDLDKLKGIVVISVGNLTLGDWQFRASPDYQSGSIKAPLDDLRKKKPMAIIGESIFVYKF